MVPSHAYWNNLVCHWKASCRAGTVYVTFKADLTKYVQHRPAILQWIVNPEASFGDLGMGLLRAITPWNEWIMGWGFDISKGEPQVTEE